MKTLIHLYKNKKELSNFLNKEKSISSKKNIIIHILSTNPESQKDIEINKTIITYLPNAIVFPVKVNSFDKKTMILLSTYDKTQDEDKLAESRTINALKQFLDNLKDGACIINDDKTLMFINKELEKLTGYPKRESIGTNIFTLLNPESQEEVKKQYVKYRYKGHTTSYNGTIVSGDGRAIPVKITGMPFFNQGSIAIIKDLREIETLKEKNRQLEESEARYRYVVEDQTELICRYNKDGIISFINKSLAIFLKKSKNEIIGKTFYELFPIPGKLETDNHTKEINFKKPVQTFNQSFRDSDEKLHQLEWTIRGIFDYKKQLQEYQAVGRDLTEMIFMEKKIKQDKIEYLEMYKSILDNMSELVRIGDKNYKTIYANPTYRKLTGYDLNEIAGKDIYDFWDKETAEKVKTINIGVRDISMFKGEGALISKKRSIIPVQIEKMPFIDGGSVLIMNDLREIKKIEKRAEQLEEMNRLKNEFIGVASHELRTPMTSIKGYLSMLLEGDFGKIPKNIRGTLETIFNSTQRQIKLINDMLDLSKLEASKIVIDKNPFVIDDILKEIMNKFIAKAKKNKYTFELVLKKPQIILNTDKNYLSKVITNLVSNAFKFTPQGGCIKIQTSIIKERKLKIEIIDNGIGIRKPDFDKVFGTFQQVHSPLVRQQAGTGLGIPITERIIKSMGSQLKLKSEFGKGSTFYFILPIYK